MWDSCSKCGGRVGRVRGSAAVIVCMKCKRAARGFDLADSCTRCGKPVERRARSAAVIVCKPCRRAEPAKDALRVCSTCGTEYQGHTNICRSCRSCDRTCEECGRPFRGDMKVCATCRYQPRQCVTCGRTFKSAFYLECGACSGRNAVTNARRRAARSGQLPLPRSVYLRVLLSGPCAYCGGVADSVDHVVPLSRGGAEAEGNLAPACEHCNKSKGAKLVSEWRPALVTG